MQLGPQGQAQAEIDLSTFSTP